MESFIAAQGFSAMGSEPRLAVLRTLVKAGDHGLSVGAIGERTGIPPSTLAHHLKFLADAGLIRSEKNGRTITTRADFTHLAALAAFILEECCADQEATDG